MALINMDFLSGGGSDNGTYYIPLVPIMKSDTTYTYKAKGQVGGKVIYSKTHANSGASWHMFNPANFINTAYSNGWYSAVNSNAGAGYLFEEPVSVCEVELRESVYSTSSGPYGIKTFKIQYSDDTTSGQDGTWNDVSNSTTEYGTHDDSIKNIKLEDAGEHLAWRVFVIDVPTPTGLFPAINMIQFYGKRKLD